MGHDYFSEKSLENFEWLKKKKFPKYWVLFLVCLISDPEERGGWDNFKFVFG